MSKYLELKICRRCVALQTENKCCSNPVYIPLNEFLSKVKVLKKELLEQEKELKQLQTTIAALRLLNKRF